MTVISEITRRFAEATTDYERLLESVARSLAEAIGDSCVVFLLDREQQALHASAIFATDRNVLEQIRQGYAAQPMQLSEHQVMLQIMTSGRALLVPRLSETKDKTPDKVRWQEQVGLHSVLLVPIQVRGESIGLLTMARYRRESPAYEPADLELAQNLTDHAGLAIENARLYQAAEEARRSAKASEEQRLKAELERDASEQQLLRTLDAMREGYTIMSRDLRYVYVNRAGAEHTHFTREQLLGRTPMELFPGFEGSKIHLALKAAAERGESRRIEEELVHASGELGYFELNIQQVPEGLVVLSIDQTERRRAEKHRDSLEEQLRQSQKMEAVGRLAGGIAHDFNNVLSIIMGYGEDVLKQLRDGDPLRDDMLEIQSAATRAADLTRQLLMFSRQQVLEPSVLSVNEVLSGIERMLRRVLGEQLELKLLPAAELGRVRVDRGNLEQVIMNLTVNARDAMPSGGRLTIETANVTVDEAFASQHLGSAPGEYVFLAITDTGTGMDAMTRARIFEPFFSTKSVGKGTGLGLSTVHGIVQQSGGVIFVYSEPGHGTTFKVYLPRVEAELDAPRPAPTAVAVELHGTETVLLVEDDVSVREVARRILERSGYTVLLAGTAADALEVCAVHPDPIQLLLTDIVMPRGNGAQLAAQVRTTRPEMKVVFMSGYTDGGIDAQGMLHQGAAFLQKPFTAQLLTRKVRATLDGQDA